MKASPQDGRWDGCVSMGVLDYIYV